MRKKSALPTVSTSKQLVFCAVFATLCCVGSILIRVPLPMGYFNVGDVFVLLAAWLIGPFYGFASAAIGSALADILGGYAVYAPATFFIKGVDAVVAYLVFLLWKKCIHKEKLDFLPRLFSAFLGETVMVVGYFFYDGILGGFGNAATAVIGNCMQGIFCLFGAVLLFSFLYPIKSVRKLFPYCMIK